MGWLDDLNKSRVYNYRCVDKDDPNYMLSGTKEELNALTVELGEDALLKFEPGDKPKILVDGELLQYEYAGFEPIEVGLVTKVVFEKNGRKGIRIKDQNGKTTIRSMTRENLLKGKGVKVTGDKLDHKGNKTGKKSYEVESTLTKACREESNKVKAKEVHSRLTGMKRNIEYQNHLAKERRKGRKK
jgi:hypothetical protein